MKLYQQQAQFAQDVALLIRYIADQGYLCTFGDAYRDPAVAAIYAKEGKGIKDSLHCKRLAIDLNIFNLDGVYMPNTTDYQQFGLYWEKLDSYNRWGGHFKRADGNHFERMEM